LRYGELQGDMCELDVTPMQEAVTMLDRRRGRAGLTYIEAQDLALRYHAKLPVWPEDDELIDDWVDLIAQLPAAEEQGRLTQAIAEADRYAGAELDQP
jgi:hypothetical protein